MGEGGGGSAASLLSMIRVVDSFHELIAGAAAGWTMKPRSERRSTKGAPWIHVGPPGGVVPSRGWKIHVSATPWSAKEVLERSLPVLVAERVPFKAAASPGVVAELNEGDGGLDQVGKFITVYPSADDQAVRVATELHRATLGLPGPAVPTDTPVASGSLVHYRYAEFVPEQGEGARAPDPAPATPDPFRAAGLGVEPSSSAIGGRFVPLSTLYRSPRGTVVLGLDLEDNRRCVLKRAAHGVRVTPEGRDARDHLREECEVLRTLSSRTRVPAVYDLVEHEGDLVLAMEYVEGETLAGLVSEGPLPVDRAVRLGAALARAVGAVHESGFVYRDLNPENVLLTGEDEVCLLDFELTRRLPDGPSLPGGSPGFSSPQQVAGEPGEIADDVYSLGAVLAFAATGAEPKAGGWSRSPARALPEALRPVVARCMQRDRAARYGSMTDIEAELASLR